MVIKFRPLYTVIQQTNGKYAVWDNAMDWFANEPGLGYYADLSHEKALEIAKMLNSTVDETE